jgi:hypothetical protein
MASASNVVLNFIDCQWTMMGNGFIAVTNVATQCIYHTSAWIGRRGSEGMERLTIRDRNGFAHATNVGYFDLVKKLAEYEDAEEQGLLLKLPCKIGDSLYQPIHKDINEYKVIGICFDITRNEWLFEVTIQIGLEWIKTVCEFSCIGKTVFLTKEEAEQALKQMGE